MQTATILHNPTTATATPTKAPPLGSSAMMAAGIALLSLWLLVRLRRRGRQIAERADTQRDTLARPNPRADDLDAAMVRMQELTRECAAQIDNRIQRLEHVLRLADERIRDMETRAAQPHRAEAPLAFAAPSSPGGHELNLRRPPADAPTHPSPPTSALDPLTRRVHELADRGRGPIEIAQQLNEPTGKIELILALRHASAI